MRTFSTLTHQLRERNMIAALVMFSSITLIHNVGDAMMSYLSPNIVEGIVHNPLWMGIIISTSSFIGFFCDFIISNLLKEKSFYTYLFWGIIIAALFPLILLWNSTIPYILLGMAAWGIYYEMILFSKSNFIHHTMPHDKHDVGWAYISGFTSLAYLIGPNLAVILTVTHEKLPLMVALVLQGIALTAALVFRFIFSKTIKEPITIDNHHPNPFLGIKTWGILNERLWPILLFMFCLVLLDATFWTVGAILVNAMKDTHEYAGILYVVYLLPGMLFNSVGVYLSRIIGKKRTAFVAGLLGGIVIACSYLASDYNFFLMFIGLAAILLAVGNPEIHGAIEDYCERLGHHANSLVGLTNSMGSLAYIIGPIIAGAIALQVGAQKTFSVIGILLAIVSLLALIVVPRKVKLPQTKLHLSYEESQRV